MSTDDIPAFPQFSPEEIDRIKEAKEQVEQVGYDEALIRTMMGPATYDFSDADFCIISKPKGRRKKNMPPSLRSRLDKIVSDD